MLFRLALLSLLATSHSAFAETTTAAYPQLGINSLTELSYDYDLTVDENCDYHFTVNFMHNPNFPVGSADTCVPGVTADDYDGKQMLEGRWFYEEYPAYIQEATEMNHLSLDYNPCGHPTGGFLVPHYDLHFYRVTPQYRAEQMICEVIPGTPACYPEQTTESGKAFFALETAVDDTGAVTTSSTSNTTTDPLLINMPAGFSSAVSDAVIFMGMHSFNRTETPASPQEWMEPTLVFVTHDSQVICFEPMLPFHYVIGDEDHAYEKTDIEYVQPTITTLPYEYSATFDASTKITTLSFSGKSQVCQADFEAAQAAYEASSMTDDTSSGAASPALWLGSGVYYVMGLIISSSFLVVMA